MAQNWLRCEREVPLARVRLVCLHHAGGGRSLYREWPDRLPPDIELWTIELPGRERRISEPLSSDPRYTLDAMVEACAVLQGRTVALFGHSLGAYLAVELARRLNCGASTARVAHVFLSAALPPALRRSCLQETGLTDQALIKHLRGLNGTHPKLLGDPEYRDLLLKIYRADLDLLENLCALHGTALVPCHATALCGSADPLVDSAAMSSWSNHFAGSFQQTSFDGDHFYLSKQTASVVSCVARRLDAIVT